MNRYITLFCLLLLLSISCVDNKKSEFEIEEIYVDINSKSVAFCELIDSVKFIKLETSDDVLIGLIHRVVIVEDKIYIHDIQTHSIFIFDYYTGYFLLKINNFGNGPGEYLDISYFEVNPKDELIEILDRNSKKLIKYDKDGKFVEERKISFYANSFGYVNNGKNIIFSKYSINDGYDSEILVFNNKLDLVNDFLKIERFTSYSIAQANQVNKFQDDMISFLPKNSPFIYHVYSDSVKSKYYVNFGKNWNDDFLYMPVKNPGELVDIANKNNYITALGDWETKDKLLIDFWFQMKYHIGLYNKITKSFNLIDLGDIDKNDLFLKGVYEETFLFVKKNHELNERMNCILPIKTNHEFDIESLNPGILQVKFK